MRLLLAFLFTLFVLGGSRERAVAARRPLVLLGTCVVVGAMYFSRRML